MAALESAINAFLFYDDGRIEMVDGDLLHDLRSTDLAFPQYASQRIRYVLVRVEGGPGKPPQLTPIWCGVFHFAADGRPDPTETAFRHRLTADAARDLLEPLSEGTTSGIVDARGRFARLQLTYRYAWTPTASDLARMSEFLEKRRAPKDRFKVLS